MSNIIKLDDYKPTPLDELEASLTFLTFSMDDFANIMAKQPALFSQYKTMLSKSSKHFLETINNLPTEQ